jgi:hypothetical protein
VVQCRVADCPSERLSPGRERNTHALASMDSQAPELQRFAFFFKLGDDTGHQNSMCFEA